MKFFFFCPGTQNWERRHCAEHSILDCMHDFLEGVVPFVIKIVLYTYVTSRLFGICAEVINSRIKRFQFSFYDQSNKPSPKFNNSLLRKKGNYNTKQRAAQKLVFYTHVATSYWGFDS